MPQSLSNVLVHLVFTTKDRQPYLSPRVREELFPYIGGILRKLGCPLLQVGGIEDHVHILFALPRTMTMAQVVEKVKTDTSKWIKTQGAEFAAFAWQAGYGVFSVSARDADMVRAYIQNQERHRHGASYQDELRTMCREASVDVDERHVWD